MKNYELEREGQIDFFDNFKIDWRNNSVLVDNTDGVWNGNLLEFKKTINNLNTVLSQAIKYLSRMRIKGESIPANILLVSLNEEICYVYKSKDYFDEIHQVYYGSASKENENFVAKSTPEKISYNTDKGTIQLGNYLRTRDFMKINIDENCIVGWAERYYRENPTASKGDFLGDDNGKVKIKGEIREPKVFKDFINPYTQKSNEKFKYLMGRLNDKLQKKDLGAFYTPVQYCEKAAELLREAIKRVPEGNDYVIIDRCAGTGNLEAVLTDEELSHCILSTYEYYEYKVLFERLYDKVRFLIPPTEHRVVYSNGMIRNADALSKEFIENEAIQEYINNPKCTIILYENPPYSESGSIQYITDENSTQVSWKNSYVLKEFGKEIKGTAKNEMANLFIWSAFKYYLRQPTDSYVVFSPIKYWKSQHIIDKEFDSGFVFNRKWFNATASAVACIYWKNIDKPTEEITLTGYDIEEVIENNVAKRNLVKVSDGLKIKKVHKTLSEFYDKRKFDEDKDGIAGGMSGEEAFRKLRVKPIYNDNILGYLISQSFGFENPRLATNLTKLAMYNGNGFYLRKDNYLEKLPLFVAGKYPIEDNWYENGIIYKSFDGGNKFTKDKDFLMKCLIFTGFSYYNKCLSFKGSDGRTYQNELCFDKDTLASKDIKAYKLNNDEKELFDLWNRILEHAKKTDKYDKKKKYGVYQITKELNEYDEIQVGTKKEKHYKYPELNTDLNALKVKLKAYYLKYIKDKLFTYQLLK